MNGGRDSIGIDEIRVEFERLFLFLLLVGEKGGSIRHDGLVSSSNSGGWMIAERSVCFL